MIYTIGTVVITSNENCVRFDEDFTSFRSDTAVSL